MTAKEYYNSTRMVETRKWTLEMALNFAEEYAEALRKHAVISPLREYEECRLCGEPTEQGGDDELCDNCFSRNDL